MTPATYNFSVVRGSAGPAQGLTVRLKSKDVNGALVTMVFDDVRLSIYDKPADNISRLLLLRATIANSRLVLTDAPAGEVSWQPTVAETRALMFGAANYYELEVRSGTEEVVYLLGVINGVGGLNDDVGDVA